MARYRLNCSNASTTNAFLFCIGCHIVVTTESLSSHSYKDFFFFSQANDFFVWPGNLIPRKTTYGFIKDKPHRIYFPLNKNFALPKWEVDLRSIIYFTRSLKIRIQRTFKNIDLLEQKKQLFKIIQSINKRIYEKELFERFFWLDQFCTEKNDAMPSNKLHTYDRLRRQHSNPQVKNTASTFTLFGWQTKGTFFFFKHIKRQ